MQCVHLYFAKWMLDSWSEGWRPRTKPYLYTSVYIKALAIQRKKKTQLHTGLHLSNTIWIGWTYCFLSQPTIRDLSMPVCFQRVPVLSYALRFSFFKFFTYHLSSTKSSWRASVPLVLNVCQIGGCYAIHIRLEWRQRLPAYRNTGSALVALH